MSGTGTLSRHQSCQKKTFHYAFRERLHVLVGLGQTHAFPFPDCFHPSSVKAQQSGAAMLTIFQ